VIAVSGQLSPVNRLLFWHFCCRRCAVSQPPDPPAATDCHGRQAVL